MSRRKSTVVMRRIRYDKLKTERAQSIAPLTRMAVGDLLRVARVGWCTSSEDQPEAVRMWDSCASDFVNLSVGEHVVLVEVLRPVTEFTPPGLDSHWISILHGDRLLEAMSDELESFQ
jgi:hypothetical protein